MLARATVGGDQERVEIHLIARPDDDPTEARRLLTVQFATFDAGKSRCFLASDRQRLLAVVEAGFGDFDEPSSRRAIIALADAPQHVADLELQPLV